jgi:hypothetical protein
MLPFLQGYVRLVKRLRDEGMSFAGNFSISTNSFKPSPPEYALQCVLFKKALCNPFSALT